MFQLRSQGSGWSDDLHGHNATKGSNLRVERFRDRNLKGTVPSRGPPETIGFSLNGSRVVMVWTQLRKKMNQFGSFPHVYSIGMVKAGHFLVVALRGANRGVFSPFRGATTIFPMIDTLAARIFPSKPLGSSTESNSQMMTFGCPQHHMRYP